MEKKQNEIDELIVNLCDKAQNLLEEDGYLDPIAFIITDTMIPCMLSCPKEDKKAMFTALGAVMKKFKSKRIILVSDIAMRVVDPEKSDEIKANLLTEQPLTYPESMRQDGIFLQDINPERHFSDAYFMQYENLKDAPRLFHNLTQLNKKEESFSGAFFDSVVSGYNDPGKLGRVVKGPVDLNDFFPPDIFPTEMSGYGF